MLYIVTRVCYFQNAYILDKCLSLKNLILLFYKKNQLFSFFENFKLLFSVINIHFSINRDKFVGNAKPVK